MALPSNSSPQEANRIWLEDRKKIKAQIQSGKLKKEEILTLVNRFDEMRCNPPPPLPPEPIVVKEETQEAKKEAKKKDKKDIALTVPSAKKEVVPKIHKKITILLTEYELSKWDEVEVFYGLIERWVTNMIRTKTVGSRLDYAVLMDSYHDIVKKALQKNLKKKRKQQ